jgi:hypothetical protein
VRVVLGADTAAFEKGLKNSEKATASFVKSVTKIASGIALERHLTSAIEGLVGGVKDAIKQAERFGEMAQQFGVGVAELSALKHSADLSGVSIETLGTSLGRMSKSMFEAADGTGPAAIAFKQLGIEVKNSDGNLRSTNEIMLEVADRFSKMQDGANKTALAMAIFGRGGAALIPLLNQGKKALEEQADEAQRFGQIISQQTAIAADRFMDTLDKIGKVWSGSINVAIAQSLPLMQTLAERYLGVAAAGDTVTARGMLMADMFMQLVMGGSRVVGFLKELDSAIQTTGQLANQFVTGRWAQLSANFQAGAARVQEIRREFEQFRAELLLAANPITLTGIQIAVYGEKAGTAAGETKKLSDAARDLLKVLASKESQVPIGQSTVERVGKELLDLPERTERAKRSYSEMQLQMEGMATGSQKVAESLRTPFEILELEMAKLPALGLSAEMFAAKMQQLGLQIAAVWGQAFGSLAGSIQTAFTAIAGENKQMLQIAKVAGAAEALINTFVAQSKALAQGGIFGFAAAAAILAQGLALVASIKAVDIGGFAQGGSFMVPGAGGIDSKKFMMSLTPGERVDVHKPSDAGNRDMIVRGIRPRDLFTGEMVREMVLQLDDWVKHGGTGIRHAR